MSKNNLSYHFKILIRYGLIYNFYDRNEFAEKYSFYEISKLGKRLITTLLNFIKPTLYMEEVDASFNTGESFISAVGLSYQTSSFIKGLAITAGNDLIGKNINYKPFSKKEQIVAG